MLPLAFVLSALLHVHVTSEGRPAAARVYVIDAAGKAYRIPDTVGYARRRETHSIVDREATIPLAPGRYTVRAEKGCEFRPVEKTIEMGGAGARVDLDIPRFYDMNAAGWYSGDLHIHREPAEMPLLIAAEALNIAPTITRHVGGASRVPPAPFPTEPSLQNQEVERLFKGHGAVILLNTPEPVESQLGDLYPMDVEFCRRARAQGGFVDGEKPIWKNVPVNVALGALDAIGVVNNHFHPHAVLLDAEKYGSMERDKPEYKTVAGFAQWMMDLYYSFLNCGFRIPVSAGSASGVMPSWIGYERVYVKPSAPFSPAQWYRDLKAGHSIATNGPLLMATVNGQAPGAEFAWKPGMRVKLSAEVHSQEPVERVELVFNGKVIGDGRSRSLTIAAPGWLAVRAIGPAAETIRFAHTSPWYFTRDGRLPVQEADAKRWAAYVKSLAAAVDPKDYPSPDAYQKAQATFREAGQVYLDRAAQGN